MVHTSPPSDSGSQKDAIIVTSRRSAPTCIALFLSVFFSFVEQLDASAEFAKVGGTVSCGSVKGDEADANGGLLPDKLTNASKAFETGLCWFNIELNGEITLDTVARLRLLLETRNRLPLPPSGAPGGRFPNPGMLIIDSPGGSVPAAISIGRMLRRARLPVSIPKGKECVSACIMILAAAVSRNYGGKIGIHRPYFAALGSRLLRPDQVRTQYENFLKDMRSYLREMNVSEKLADDMLKIEPADVRYLSYNELEQYGLVWIDPIEQETLDLQDAKSLNLSRQEYIRRQGLVRERCDLGALVKQLGRRVGLDEVDDCWAKFIKSGN